MRASVVARLGGGAAHPVNACAWRGRERTSHQSCSLPDLRLMIVGSWRSVAHTWSRSVTSSVPTWLELDVWLARSPSPLRREELLHREDGPSRQHVKHRSPNLV